MKTPDKVLVAFYGLLAAGALYATWSNNLEFFGLPDNGGLAGFIAMSYANPAAASISNDLLFACLAIFAFMLAESRRIGMRFVWVYIVLSLVVAVSVMTPLFLAARQIRLAERKRHGSSRHREAHSAG